MRKYLGSIAVVGCAIAISPLVESSSSASASDADNAPTVAVQQVRVPPIGGLRDEAAMVLVGTALIGLASAVRRAA